jgi:hypothetical protein
MPSVNRWNPVAGFIFLDLDRAAIGIGPGGWVKGLSKVTIPHDCMDVAAGFSRIDNRVQSFPDERFGEEQESVARHDACGGKQQKRELHFDSGAKS